MKKGVDKKREAQNILVAVLSILIVLYIIFAFYNISKPCPESELKGELATSSSRRSSDDYVICAFDVAISLNDSPTYTIYGMQKNKYVCPACLGSKVGVHEVTFPNPIEDNFYITACDTSNDYTSDDYTYACYEARFTALRPEATVCHQCKKITINTEDESNTVSAVDIKQKSAGLYLWELAFTSACNPDPHCPVHESCPGDTDGDGQVDSTDLEAITENWLSQDCSTENGCCGGADVNGDGVVNMDDFAIVAGSIGYCPDRFD